MAHLHIIVWRVIAGLLFFVLVGGALRFLKPGASVPLLVWAATAGIFAMAFVLWGQSLRFVPRRTSGRLGTWFSYPLSVACLVLATYVLWLVLAAASLISAP